MANKKIRIRLKAYEHRTLDTAAEKIVETATRTGATVAGPVPLPTERSLYTIIRATHKYKDSREQFEMRTHKRLIDIINPTQKTVDALMKLDLPSGVNVEINLSLLLSSKLLQTLCFKLKLLKQTVTKQFKLVLTTNAKY